MDSLAGSPCRPAFRNWKNIVGAWIFLSPKFIVKFKNWPFTSNLTIRLFWPFVGPTEILAKNDKITKEFWWPLLDINWSAKSNRNDEDSTLSSKSGKDLVNSCGCGMRIFNSSLKSFKLKLISFLGNPGPELGSRRWNWQFREKHGKIRIPNFCYSQVIVFDLSYLPVAAVGT